jgi:hypothetical protein
MAIPPRQAESSSTPKPTPQSAQNKPAVVDGRDIQNTQPAKEVARIPRDQRSDLQTDAGAAPSKQTATNSPQVGKASTNVGQDGALAEVIRKNSRAKAEQFFKLPQRVPLQIFNEETWVQKLGHWGPAVTGLASLLLTGFVWVKTAELTERQVAIQDAQLQLQKQQSEAQTADTRFKFLTDLASPEEKTRTSAEIALARHPQAFPVVHYALGLENDDIRKSALNVVYRLFQGETKDGRDALLNRLMKEFESPNKTLQTGIVQSFVKIESLLNPDQRRTVINSLQQNVAPQKSCTELNNREVVFEAANFVSSNRVDAMPYLLTVANVPRCGDAWIQAMYNILSFVPGMSAEERFRLREQIQQIKKDALDHLDRTAVEQDLAAGAGFAAFLSDGEVAATFEAFTKRVEKEFDALIAQLG